MGVALLQPEIHIRLQLDTGEEGHNCVASVMLMKETISHVPHFKLHCQTQLKQRCSTGYPDSVAETVVVCIQLYRNFG
jgi:hypothetical protein